jgi:pimeloyl-ACP methyl ester carboxylesterase
MKLNTFAAKQTVTSHDGTVIGYRMIGDGPGLVLVQGAMGTEQNYHELALAMAEQFTVYLPDRRGRAMSPRPYSPQHTIRDDVEDIRCLLAQTGARYLFGLSSGAMIVLEALRNKLPVERAAVFEPPFYLDGMALHLVERFNTQVECEQLADALVTVLRIVGLGSPRLRSVPDWLLRIGAKFALRTNGGRPAHYASLSDLIPAMRYDFNVVAALNERPQDLRVIDRPVLLMGGDKSPDYLKNALVMLKVMLPNADWIQLSGVDHSAPWNADLNGKPSLVGGVLKEFFGDDAVKSLG